MTKLIHPYSLQAFPTEKILKEFKPVRGCYVRGKIELPPGQAELLWASLRNREGAEPWVFYEGPPTANGRPGSHHVLARVFKDIYPRFKTMRGYYVERKGGWDCHGLPIELQVEKNVGRAKKLAMSKAEIIHLGSALGLDYGQTVSCYQADAQGQACGECESCKLRQIGFAQAGVTVLLEDVILKCKFCQAVIQIKSCIIIQSNIYHLVFFGKSSLV